MELCKACKGWGQTNQTRTIVEKIAPRKWKTKQLGSGCPDCLGLGIVGERNVRQIN